MIIMLLLLAPCLIAAYFYAKMVEYREKYELEKRYTEKLLSELKEKA